MNATVNLKNIFSYKDSLTDVRSGALLVRFSLKVPIAPFFETLLFYAPVTYDNFQNISQDYLYFISSDLIGHLIWYGQRLSELPQ
jgi:hypothetical protein